MTQGTLPTKQKTSFGEKVEGIAWPSQLLGFNPIMHAFPFQMETEERNSCLMHQGTCIQILRVLYLKTICFDFRRLGIGCTVPLKMSYSKLFSMSGCKYQVMDAEFLISFIFDLNPNVFCLQQKPKDWPYHSKILEGTV